MAPAQRRSGSDTRWRAKTPAERGEEAADVQRRLKREAAERRQAGATRARDAGSSPPRGRAAGRRRTP